MSNRGLHSYSLHPTFKIFSSPFDVVLWRSTITIANGTHSSSVFRRLEIQVSCLPHPITYPISIKIMCFCLDNSPTLSPTPSKYWAFLALHTDVNAWSWKLSMPRVCCICNCQILLSTSSFNSDIISFCDCKQYQMSH